MLLLLVVGSEALVEAAPERSRVVRRRTHASLAVGVGGGGDGFLRADDGN